VGVHEAKTQLSRLLARVEAGEQVEITNRGKTVALLVPPPGPTQRRVGMDAGRFTVPDDFDAPLPDDVLDAFER
jgi:antitoxin (DNA-binding transcriptional repressor) of toxin-antitoxin stability system